MFHLLCCFLFCFLVLVFLLKQQKFIFSQFWRLVIQGQGAGRTGFSWALSLLVLQWLPRHCVFTWSFVHAHSSCLCFFLLVLEGLLGRLQLSLETQKLVASIPRSAHPKAKILLGPPCSWNVSVILHQEVGVPVLSPLNWANLCNCLDQKNSVKLTQCDFQN